MEGFDIVSVVVQISHRCFGMMVMDSWRNDGSVWYTVYESQSTVYIDIILGTQFGVDQIDSI